jgi:hypothetical protein
VKCRSPLLLALFAGLPACAGAQANPDSIHRRNDCRLAAQVLTTGQPRPRLEWAAHVMPGCPQAGRTVATALSEYRTSSDTALLNWITLPANSLRDGEVFQAAMGVLQDRSATATARVFANRVLMWLLYPTAGVYYSTLVDLDGDGRHPCIAFGASSHASVREGAVLPDDWRGRIHAANTRIMQDDGEPAPVRQSAVCLVLRSSRP